MNLFLHILRYSSFNWMQSLHFLWNIVETTMKANSFAKKKMKNKYHIYLYSFKIPIIWIIYI